MNSFIGDWKIGIDIMSIRLDNFNECNFWEQSTVKVPNWYMLEYNTLVYNTLERKVKLFRLMPDNRRIIQVSPNTLSPVIGRKLSSDLLKVYEK